MSGVSVVVPVRDDPRLLRAIASILALAGEVDALEVIVIDHRSGPSFSAVVDALPAPVIVVREERDTVYEARNRGLARASHEFVAFTDADCVARPGWLAEAVRHLNAGADIVQGYSGSLGSTRLDRILQRRAAARFNRLPAGAPTECDTKNLAVRRRVFETVGFPARWRRVGDTEFGLRARQRGFRVEYCPSMRIDHDHELDLPLFAAKQVCHGWGAQRLMVADVTLPWSGGHLRQVARVAGRFARLPGRRLLAGLGVRVCIEAARGVERLALILPEPVGVGMATALDKGALLAGHLLYSPDDPEPAPSALLRREPLRD